MPQILLASFLLFFCIATLHVLGEVRMHFFYDRTGTLTIDGSVKGKSEPITVDMKAQQFSCAKKQYFVFTFCPDQKLLKTLGRGCEEGITFCYDPVLTEEVTREQFCLKTNPTLDVSKKCGELFRGFKVALKRMMYANQNKRAYFYEIQTGYQAEAHYFEMPYKRCISLWLGNDADLTTSIRTIDRQPLFPVQVRRKSLGDILGVTNATYNRPWPKTAKKERYADGPGLSMLYLDFKSREFTPQMIFTVGPEEQCNLYARVHSNNVGKCSSGFKQRTIALRPYGHNTTSFYKLTIESGVETNETSGSKSKQQKILDKEFSETTMEETDETQRDEGIQSYNENVEPTKEQVLKHTSHEQVEEKDITPPWKKAAAAAINVAAAIGCGALSFVTGGFASCSANVEFKDVQTTKFHEAYTQSSISNKKTTQSSNSVHSVQKVMQTAFTHTKGTTTSTSHSEQRSMSNAVTKRTIFVYEIEVPSDKIMTPMQMTVNCDNNRVSIPWIKFRLSDPSDGFTEDYGEDEGKLDTDTKGGGSGDDEDATYYDVGPKGKKSEQEMDAERAFKPPQWDEDPYSDYEGGGGEGKPGKTGNANANADDDDVYYDLKTKMMANLVLLSPCFLLPLLLSIGLVIGQRQQWEPANYPNPTAGDWQRCNMRSRSLLCDPDAVLGESERYRVNYELGQLEGSTRQDHGRDFCEKKGITAAVALARRVRGGNEQAVRTLANDMLRRWNIDEQCQKAIMVVLSVEDRSFWVARMPNVPVYGTELNELFKAERENFRAGHYAQGIQNVVRAIRGKALAKQQPPPDDGRSKGTPFKPAKPQPNRGGGGGGGGGFQINWLLMLALLFFVIIPLLCCCGCIYFCCCRKKNDESNPTAGDHPESGGRAGGGGGRGFGGLPLAGLLSGIGGAAGNFFGKNRNRGGQQPQQGGGGGGGGAPPPYYDPVPQQDDRRVKKLAHRSEGLPHVPRLSKKHRWRANPAAAKVYTRTRQ